jgi:hypothetical protein
MNVSIVQLAKAMEGSMNSSFYDLDRDAHIKVVFVALCAAIAVMSVALLLH